jgi:hypothetical protein
MTLLNKGFKYNLHHKPKFWIKQSALEAETALTLLPQLEQEPIRYQINKNIKKLLNTTNRRKHNITYTFNERKTLMRIKQKLLQHDATAIKADKGNSIVIVYQTDYHKKIFDFVNNNDFIQAPKDMTMKFQRDVRTLINKSPGIIPPKQKWKYTCMNPTAPSIRGLIKIHKDNAPIRPVVNWKNAPAYKIAKKFSQHISTYLPLPFAFNVKNSQHLITDLGEVQLNSDSNMVSFDITNMYTNIPTDVLPHIIQILCDQNIVTPQNCNEMLQMCRLVTSQNYFTLLSSTYIQHNGLAMGSPTSSVLSETFLQFLEHTKTH